jgi:plasmid stabilization system protein ParE
MVSRVELTAKAKRDLDAILEWLVAQEAGEAGLRWYARLQKEIGSLSALAYRCPLAPENGEFPFEIRQLLYGRRPHQYRILYTVEGETVIVLHIRHGRRRRLGKSQ